MVAAVCQAAGLLLSKQGMGHGWLPEGEHLAPQSATLVRMFFAGVGIVPVALFSIWKRMPRERFVPTRDSRATTPTERLDRTQAPWVAGVGFAAIGTLAGPFLGVWMSLIASDRIPLGIAQTLSSLTPILILPFAARVHHERIGARAIVGAGIAILGLTCLFLFPS
ncbi:MAG: DMT family transporter [Planctomycetota bacterium]